MRNAITQKGSFLAPLTILYVILLLLIFVTGNLLRTWKVDVFVLHGANTVLFLTATLASLLTKTQMSGAGTQAVLKSLYGGFLIRFLGIALAAFVYIWIKRKDVNIPGLVGGAFFYVLYWSIEIRMLREKIKSPSAHA